MRDVRNRQAEVLTLLDKSHLPDEIGAAIAVALMTLGEETRTTTNCGYKIKWRDLMPGTRTRLVYRSTGIWQPESCRRSRSRFSSRSLR